MKIVLKQKRLNKRTLMFKAKKHLIVISSRKKIGKSNQILLKQEVPVLAMHKNLKRN